MPLRAKARVQVVEIGVFQHRRNAAGIQIQPLDGRIALCHDITGLVAGKTGGLEEYLLPIRRNLGRRGIKGVAPGQFAKLVAVAIEHRDIGDAIFRA